MKKFLQILSKIIGAWDYIYFTIVFGSFITLFFVDDGSWKLIAVSSGVLFTVALISSLAQKFNEYYENNPRSAFTKQYDYEITTQSSDIGKRQTIENFDSSDEFPESKELAPADKSDNETKEQPKQPESKASISNNIDEELSSVRIVKKIKLQESSSAENSEDSEPKNNLNPANAKDLGTVDISNDPIIEKEKIEREKIEREKIETKSEETTETGRANQKPKDYKKIQHDFSINVFFENHPLFGNEPKQELEYFITRMLMIIKSTVSANTIALLLFDKAQYGLKLYSYVTENDDNIIKDSFIKFGDDILSEIVRNSKPELLTNINLVAVKDIFPYYKQSIEIKSFAGIPIFHKNEPIGVLAIDSFEENSIDSNVIGYVANFTKLISSIITSLNEKFEQSIATRVLHAIEKYDKLLKQENFTFTNIINYAFSTISDILGFENIGYCNYSSQTNKWQVQSIVGNEKFVSSLKNATIDLNKALIKTTLLENQPICLAPIEQQLHIINPQELFSSKGYFAAFPLKSHTSSYGAIFIYGDRFQNISSFDLKILNIFIQEVANTIEKFLYINIYSNYSHINHNTGIFHPNAFFERLGEELNRALHFNYKVAFVAVHIDNFEEYSKNYGLAESLIQYQIEYLGKHLRSFDLIGHINDNIIGILLVDYNSADLKLWSEKVRAEIASKFVKFDNKRFTITLSIGASLSTPKETVETLMNNSIEMLREASKKTNTVCIYER